MADLRYIGKFGSADGNVYQVRLHDSDFDGASTEFPLESVLFVRGRRGADIFTPIRASSVELVGYKLSSTALDELLGAEVGRFTKEIWRGADHATLDGGGGSMYWKGIVQTDLGEDDTASEISSISITATDGLSLLRDVSYLDTTGEEPAPFTGRPTHLETIRVCLDKIGYSLPISVSGSWYPEEGAGGDVLWEHAEVDQAIFYDDDGSPASCYEVLKQILYPYGGILFWRDGRFVIIQKEQIGASTYTTRDYDETDTFTGTTVYGSTADADLVTRLTGQRTYKTAHGGLTVVYNHGNIPSLIRSGDFSDASEWTLGASGGEIRTSGGRRLVPPRDIGRYNPGRIERIKVGFIPAFHFGSDTSFGAFRDAIKASNRYVTQTGEEVQAGDIIAFTGRFRIPYNEGDGNGLYNTFFELQIGSNADAYLSRSGAWYTPSGSDDLQPMRVAGSEYNDYGFALSRDPGEGWYDFTIISEASPYTGDVRLVLYGTGDENGADLDPEGVEWADVAVLIVDEDGNLRDSISFSGATTSPEPLDDDLVLIVGQGPHPAVPGGISWDGVQAGDWTDGAAGPENVSQLLVRKRLGYQSQRLELRYETYTGLDYEMGDPVQIDGELYDVTFHEKDLASQDDTIEAVRIRYDDSGISFTEAAEDIGNYVPGGGGSTSVIQAPADSVSVIAEKGDLIVGDGEGNPTRFDSGEDDGKVMVTDGESSTGWSLSNITPIIAKGDLIVGDGEGNPVRLPAPADGYFWVADSTEALGWAAVSINAFGTLTEIATDYRGDANVRRKLVTAKAAQIGGSGTVAAMPWVITQDELPDELIDSDESTAEASGAPGLRASLDALGLQQIPLEIFDFTPASGGAGGGATAEIWLWTTEADATSGQPVYLWWNKSGKTQPAATAEYGSEAVWQSVEFASHDGGITDSSGNITPANNGSSAGSQFKIGAESRDFDGTDDHIDIDISADPTEYTHLVWIRPDDVNRRHILGRTDSSGPTVSLSHDLRITPSGKAEHWLFDGGFPDVIGTTTLSTGTWYQIIGTAKNSGNAKLYVNATSEGTPAAVGTMWTGGDRLDLGEATLDSYSHFDGHIDEVWIIYTELDSDGITTLYNNQNDPSSFWDTTASVESGPF